MENKQSLFQFLGFRILKSTLVIDENHTKFDDFEFGLDIKGKYVRSEKQFKLYLNFIIHHAETNFICEVNSLGLFNIDDTNEDNLNNYLYTNAPALIFPYLRAYISNLTLQSGIDSIVLPTMNLSRIVHEDFKDEIIIEN